MAAAIADLPIIEFAPYFGEDAELREKECLKAANSLREYGVLVVRDPRVDMKYNNEFIDMMEDYYGQPLEDKLKDVKPEYSYQVGATPEMTEKARNHCSKTDDLKEADRPTTLCPPGKDPKWRYFHRVGARPEKSEFAQLNAEQVIPEKFPQWVEVMDKWGVLMLEAAKTSAEMAALGLGLEKDSLTSLMVNAPHLLAPTGSDLERFGEVGTVLASWHYDLNLLTIHGKSRYPGLFIWLRDGSKVLVKVPEGCLLLQAGKQLEWLTAGAVLCGFHEVVVCDETMPAIERQKAAGRPLWRVSSTLFSHVASDQTLLPLGPFATEEALAKYPAIKAGAQVAAELSAIKLGKGEVAAMGGAMGDEIAGLG